MLEGKSQSNESLSLLKVGQGAILDFSKKKLELQYEFLWSLAAEINEKNHEYLCLARFVSTQYKVVLALFSVHPIFYFVLCHCLKSVGLHLSK